MINRLVASLAIVLSFGSPAISQERVTLGWGRLLNNDALGDGKDRWRTGSYVLSRVRGPSWTGALPEMPGEIWNSACGLKRLPRRT